MASRRAKANVLSRQEIALRRRSLNEEKLKTSPAARRAIGGVFILALSVLSFLSVVSFDVHDRVGPGFRNAIGPTGHALAELLRGSFGLMSYLVPLAGLTWAMSLFLGAKGQRRWPQLVSLAVLTVAGGVLVELIFRGQPGFAHPPGGALGREVAEVMCGLFSTIGTVVLVSAACAAALIIGAQTSFLKICSLIWQGMGLVRQKVTTFAVALWEKQKEALAAQREAAAKAKEEEAELLAELEENEQKLHDAERAADEAEAIAEEAMRLSKEAEAARLAKLQAKEAAREAKETKRKGRVDQAETVVASSTGVEPTLAATGTDPAWTTSFAPVSAAAAAPAENAKGAAKRKAPTLVTAPLPPGAQGAGDSPAATSTATLAPEAPLAAALSAIDPSAAAVATGAAAGTAGAASGSALAVAPPKALARTPVIVEPKAPPKPVVKKVDQNQFEFVGDRKSFQVPPLDVLECDKQERSAIDKEAYFSTAEKLRAKLADFGIVGEVVEIRPGPVVTMYEFLPGPGIKVSKIASLADDLAMAMEAMRVRIVAPIPGKGVVGIEVPNRDRETVYLKEIAEQDAFLKSQSRLTMCVGKDIEGMPYVLDLAKAPHLLIAGTTGSGKSVAVNSMIMSILLKSTPEEVRFIMVDPKMLELSVYEGIPHLLLPVVTDPKKAALALRWAVEEMERRYHLLSEAGVRNIAGYNKAVEQAQEEAAKAAKERKAGRAKKTELSAVPGSAATQTVDAGAITAKHDVSERKAEAAAGKPRKLLIVDVGEGESEDEALARNGTDAPAVGIPAPWEEKEEPRTPVESEATAEAQAEVAAEIRVDETTLSAAEAAAEAEAEADAAGARPEERKKLPYIVVIIDELADLMMVASREVETYIARLAQMARAAGIHLMVATQRPSTDVVTGVIKANFPTRISFMLRSKPDSMTILGTIGAEALLGMGDMLIMPPTSAHLQRVHGAFVSEVEIKRAVDMLKAQGKPVYDDSILKPRDEEAEGGAVEDELSDELYDQALAAVAEMRSVSISMLQRKMRIGYNRAARMIERMEREGVVGPADGAKPREVLIRQLGEMPGASA